MKKILFALASTVVCLLTSCFGEPGGYHEESYYVIVDTTSSPISFVEFYQGNKYGNFSNLRGQEQLTTFNIENAPVAFVKLRFDYDESYTLTSSVSEAYKISPLPITNSIPTDSLQPLLMLSSLYDLSTPIVWVRDGYLSVCPIVPSEQAEKYFLMPEKATNDTLFFNLFASYKENPAVASYNSLFYDLRTLSNTSNASPELKDKMTEMLTAMEQHRRDSMCVVLKYGEKEYNFNYLGNDTVRTRYHISNYFKCNF